MKTTTFKLNERKVQTTSKKATTIILNIGEGVWTLLRASYNGAAEAIEERWPSEEEEDAEVYTEYEEIK